MLHEGAVVVGARVVVGACVVAGALVVVVTRTVVGNGQEDWVSVVQPVIRKEITNGVTQRFMSPVFQRRPVTPIACTYLHRGGAPQYWSPAVLFCWSLRWCSTNIRPELNQHSRELTDSNREEVHGCRDSADCDFRL